MGNKFSFGMKTAAKSYFGKGLERLSCCPAWLFLLVFHNATQYDPYANPDASKERRNTVLDEMCRRQEYF